MRLARIDRRDGHRFLTVFPHGAKGNGPVMFGVGPAVAGQRPVSAGGYSLRSWWLEISRRGRYVGIYR